MPVSGRSRSAILAPLAAGLIALGCVSAPDGPLRRRSDAAPTVTETTAPAGTDPDGTDTPEEFADDVDDARKLAEEYWNAEFRRSGLDLHAGVRADRLRAGGRGGLRRAAARAATTPPTARRATSSRTT